MKTVKIKNLVIGEGRPKICVPLIGSADAILETAHKVKESHADLVEWRIDTDFESNNPVQVLRTAEKLRGILNDLPLLFTFRTKNEGGNTDISEQDYCNLNKEMIASGLIDLVDIEYFRGKTIVETLIESAGEKNVRTVLSNHDFRGTPSTDEIVRRLCSMQEAGGDLVKIALMPQSEEDVIKVLQATWRMKTFHPLTPVITMSMGKRGIISRISGELFGSDVTFASYDKASAPGQLQVEEVYEILQKLHVSYEMEQKN